MTLPTLSDTSFTLPTGPALVIFSAPWCGPCKVTKASMQHLTTPGFEVNGEANPGLMAQFQVQTFPTILLFKDGAVKAATYGGKSSQQLRDWVARHA